MAKEHITREGYQRLVEQIEKLRERRRRLTEARQHATSFGNLQEHAEFDATEHELNFNETRIAQLQQRLLDCEIVEPKEPSDPDLVAMGAVVRLADLSRGGEIEYFLTDTLLSDADQGRISTTAPLGQALLTHRAGETVTVQTPEGRQRYKILSVRF